MRLVWFSIGSIALVAAAAGLVLPLVPTTPFLLVGAFAFSRSSPRLAFWLTDHPRFGQPIRHWRSCGTVARKTKAVALATMIAAPTASMMGGVPTPVLVAQCAILAMAAGFVLTRPEPRQSRRLRTAAALNKNS